MASRPKAISVAVLDCAETIAGRFAASVLAGQGASVTRPSSLSPLGGPTERFVSRGVRSSATATSAEEWDRLLSESDVLITDGRFDGSADMESLAEKFPKLVILSATPYGIDEPSAPATMLTLAAESGFLGITGEPEGPPEMIRGHVNDFACGWAIASAAWAGVRARAITGHGKLIRLSLLEVLVFLQWNSTQRAAFENIVMKRQGARGMGHPWGVYPCKDGHVVLIVGAGGRNWARFAQLMDEPRLMDEKFSTAAGRAAAADEIDALMLPWLLDHRAQDIFTRAQELNLPFGMVQSASSVVRDEQLNSRDFFARAPDGNVWPQLPYRINGVRPSWEPWPTSGAVK